MNLGLVPYDPNTPVGQFRVRAGDTQYTELDPPVPGAGNYMMWSDLEIQGFLAANSSPTWAIYEAYLQVATSAALEAKNIKDQDLAINTEKRAEALRQIALLWRQRAEEDDANNGLSDEFVIVPTGVSGGEAIPEGTIAQWGRIYTGGPVYRPAPDESTYGNGGYGW